jgi:hypothetical protein
LPVLNQCAEVTTHVHPRPQLPNLMETYINIGWWLFGACVLISILLPWFIIPFVPIVALYKASCFTPYRPSNRTYPLHGLLVTLHPPRQVTEYYFVPTARELQRLDAVSRSPMVSHFSETVSSFAHKPSLHNPLDTSRATRSPHRFPACRAPLTTVARQLTGITTIRASAMGPVFNARAIEYLDRPPPLPSLPYKVDTSRPSVRTDWTRLVHPRMTGTSTRTSAHSSSDRYEQLYNLRFTLCIAARAPASSPARPSRVAPALNAPGFASDHCR